ncbi:archaemetzincin family Zn-dependent metalloprotease [candidate division KSB1 bacterium]|nr:archaemetzincin family Zn-dependent metalloprotease [candidate division KSB1 bacterium]
MTRSICVIPIEFQDQSLIKSLRRYLAQTFEVQVDIRNKKIDTARAYDQYRNQYHSSDLLKQLIDDPPDKGACKILGLCKFDLFIPIFTYVFGEAQLNGLGALVSTHRLESEFYGGHEDHELLKERLIKEANHELGHTFGLVHCKNAGCVMNFSTYVEDIDEKNILFCNECTAIIKQKR